jgi:uncharacterized delta-60 repeat protein
VNRRVLARTAAALVVSLAGLASPASAGAQPPGSLDSSFNGSGIVTLGGGSQLFGVAVQPNGEVVAAGQSGGSVLVVRYSVSGAPDGQYLGPAGAARAVAIQPDGKIVIAGTSGGAMFVERLTSGLQPDPSFGSNGVATALGGQSAVANGVAVAPSGAIVAVGSVGGPNTAFGAASFSSGGTLAWSEAFDPLGLPYAVARGVTVQPDGAIVIAGVDQGSPNYPFFNGLVVRLSAGGALDASFNGSGVVSYHYPGGGYTGLNAVTLQADGKIVAAGVDAGGPNAVFLRLNPDGSFDQGFGSAGVAALPSGQNISDNPGAPIGANGVGIDGGGTIVGAGNFENTATATDAAAWAFSAAGAPESGFGSGGVVRGPTSGYESCALAIAPDGSILAAGDTVVSEPDSSPCPTNGSASGFIARYIGFGPPPAPSSTSAPSVTTGAASGIGETSAEVAGQVDPGGLQTSYHFDYGTTTGYGHSSSTGTVPAGSSAVAVSAQLTGLTPDTKYHYRLVASNADGAVYGADGTLTTAPPSRPSATTGAASAIGEVSAEVAGSVGTGGLATSYHFEYGKTASYGSSTPQAAALPATAANFAVSARLTHLTPGTKYHYRLVATNADGTSYGSAGTFTTLPRLRAPLSGVAHSYKIAVIAKHGLRLGVGCSQACSITGSLVISAATANNLKLGTSPLWIGGGSGLLRHAGTAHPVLRLSAKGKGMITHLTAVVVSLRIVAKPSRGGPSVSHTTTITLIG